MGAWDVRTCVRMSECIGIGIGIGMRIGIGMGIGRVGREIRCEKIEMRERRLEKRRD